MARKCGQPLGAESSPGAGSQQENWNLSPLASGTEFCQQPCELGRKHLIQEGMQPSQHFDCSLLRP